MSRPPLSGQADQLIHLYRECYSSDPDTMQLIAGAGSDRVYYRLAGPLATVVGTVGTNLQENLAFIALSRHLADMGLPVPRVLNVSADSMCYLQQDLGDTSLLSLIQAHRSELDEPDSPLMHLLERTMETLARIQTLGARLMDWSVCFPSPAMDRNMVAWDLNYFKYDFLKLSGVEFSEPRLQQEFDALTAAIMQCCDGADTLMLRDFQSRNVMVAPGGEPYVIDFQGARRGPRQYDVASMLWQAKANLPAAVRNHLIDCYCRYTAVLDPAFDEARFRATLPLFVLLRQLQTLGAYGFRGWCEGKAHFLQSVAPGVDAWEKLMAEPELRGAFPYLRTLAMLVADSEPVRQARLLCQATTGRTGLTVCIQSFSYKHGMPADLSGNGGGYVFDCRAMHNPGRYDEYKSLTGLDAPVIEFLEAQGEVQVYMQSVCALVDSSVERYLQRGFTNLSVGFGCTGGQHRSVYCAEALGRHIRSKYPQVNIVVFHRQQNIIRQ